MFADCATPPENGLGVLQVRTTEPAGEGGSGLVCFEVLDTAGHLELMVPAVYEIRGDGYAPGAGHNMSAQLTTDSGQQTTARSTPTAARRSGSGRALSVNADAETIAG